MGEPEPSAVENEYALGRSAGETRRLILQHQIYAPLTRRFLVAAGVTAGMRVLDLGSGAGDVALLLAELVGPQGRVVGVDMSAEILDAARARVQSASWSTVSLHHVELAHVGVGPGHAPPFDRPFDAVVGRWILMYVPEPAELLRRARTWVRPGGLVAFQESDLRNAPRPWPPAPLHEQVLRWTTPPPGAPGPDLEMGPKLFAAFVKAGLPAPQLRVEAPAGGGPDWPGYACLTETVRSLQPFLERLGVVTPEEVGIETLEARLRDEIVSRDGVQVLPFVVGAWART
jgi:SAM-dependent methyltransferase